MQLVVAARSAEGLLDSILYVPEIISPKHLEEKEALRSIDRRPATTRKTCVVHTRLGAYDDDFFDDDFCLLFEGFATYNMTATVLLRLVSVSDLAAPRLSPLTPK